MAARSLRLSIALLPLARTGADPTSRNSLTSCRSSRLRPICAAKNIVTSYLRQHIAWRVDRLITWCLSWAFAVVPSSPLAVVCSPSHEGNGIETLRWLDRQYKGSVVWLVDTPVNPQVASWVLSSNIATRIVIKRQRSVGALWILLRAELIFFTANFYGGPMPRGRRFVVNLWHGDGPKTVAKGLPPHGLRSNIVVAGTKVWGQQKAKTFKLPPSDVVVCGNPRIDQYSRPASDSALRHLGLDPRKPLVLWAPTFRAAKISGPVSELWIEAAQPFAFADLVHAAPRLLRLAEHSGLQIVVKPHPLDCAAFNIPGISTITNDDLNGARTTLYQLLARAQGLVTDYSSIWTDYIPLSRPIGLYCPDIADYAAGRGFELPDDFHVNLPGPLLSDVTQLIDFLETVARGEDIGHDRRQSCVERLGIVTEVGATQRLMNEISSRFELLGT
jgi:CDP-glycerol glycerophosphotransferase